MSAVRLAGAVADPRLVGREEVQPIPRGPQQRTLVVEYEHLVTCVQLDAPQRAVVDAARGHEPQTPVDLGGDALVTLSGTGAAHEVHVPLMQVVQIGQAGRRDRTCQVHRGRGVGVRTDQPTGVGPPRLRCRLQRVDHVTAVGGEARQVGIRATRLGVLARDTPDLDDWHRAVPYVKTTAICNSVRIVPRRCTSVLSTNVSAQSPPCNRNAPPRATAPRRSWSLSTSAATAMGGTPSSTMRTRPTSSGSGHTGCWAAGRAIASLTAAAKTPGSGDTVAGRTSATSTLHDIPKAYGTPAPNHAMPLNVRRGGRVRVLDELAIPSAAEHSSTWQASALADRANRRRGCRG